MFLPVNKVFNAKKKGTIVLSSIRSGTKHLSWLIYETLKNFNIQNVVDINTVTDLEIFHDIIFTSSKSLISKNLFINRYEEPYKEQYSILNWIYGHKILIENKELKDYIYDNYHIVKLVRSDRLAHLMSIVIHRKISKHFCDIKEFPDVIPYLPTRKDIFMHIISIRELNELPYHQILTIKNCQK